MPLQAQGSSIVGKGLVPDEAAQALPVALTLRNQTVNIGDPWPVVAYIGQLVHVQQNSKKATSLDVWWLER